MSLRAFFSSLIHCRRHRARGKDFRYANHQRKKRGGGTKNHLPSHFHQDDVLRLHCSLLRLHVLDSHDRVSYVRKKPGVAAARQASASNASFSALCISLELNQQEKKLLYPFFSFLNEGAEMVSFQTFSFYLWNFCTLNERALARLALGVLSPPSRAELVCERHMLTLMKALHQEGFQEHKHELYEALAGITHNAHTFSLLCVEYPVLMKPLRRLQARLRYEVLGDSFWRRHALTRAVAGRSKMPDPARFSQEVAECEDGLLRNVVEYYYALNTSNIHKSKSPECEFLNRHILTQCSKSEFLEAPFDMLQRARAALSVGEDEASCRHCSHSFFLLTAASPSRLRQTHRQSQSQSRSNGSVLTRSHSATVVLLSQQQQQQREHSTLTGSTKSRGMRNRTLWPTSAHQQQGSSTDIDSRQKKFTPKNNIYCCSQDQQHMHFRCEDENDDDRNDTREQQLDFLSCSSLTTSSMGLLGGEGATGLGVEEDAPAGSFLRHQQAGRRPPRTRQRGGVVHPEQQKRDIPSRQKPQTHSEAAAASAVAASASAVAVAAAAVAAAFVTEGNPSHGWARVRQRVQERLVTAQSSARRGNRDRESDKDNKKHCGYAGPDSGGDCKTNTDANHAKREGNSAFQLSAFLARQLRGRRGERYCCHCCRASPAAVHPAPVVLAGRGGEDPY